MKTDFNGAGIKRGQARYGSAVQNSWDESKHPRADDGKFGSGGGGGGDKGGKGDGGSKGGDGGKEKPAAVGEGKKGFKSVFRGDEVEHTGETVKVGDRDFFEFVYLEGVKKGKKGVMPKSEDKKADASKEKAERDEQQAGFRRLREAQKKS